MLIAKSLQVALRTKEPFATYDETIAYGVKTKAEKKFLSNTYLYDNPKELDAFLAKFEMLCERAKKEKANH